MRTRPVVRPGVCWQTCAFVLSFQPLGAEEMHGKNKIKYHRKEAKNHSARDMIASLERQAKTIRCLSIEMIANAGTGHPGGALSAAEIMSVLYFHVFRVDPKRPHWEDSDRFVLSKGHGTAAWYAALVRRATSPRTLKLFRQKGGILQGHPDMRKVPGVDMTAGSLGQGLSAGLGMALAARMQRQVLPRLRPAGRWRDPRGPGMGSGHGEPATSESII